MVRSSPCLHQWQGKLLTQACTGPLRRVVSHEHCVLFSDVVELASILATGDAARACDFSAAPRLASAESRKDFDNHAG